MSSLGRIFDVPHCSRTEARIQALFATIFAEIAENDKEMSN
jgi:hypothetical protein